MSPLPTGFRVATLADVNAIVALVQSAYRGPSSRVGWTTEADLLGGRRIDAAGVGEVIRRPESLVLLRGDGAGLLACAHVERRGVDGYFGMFAVRPGGQGRGVGRAMLTLAEHCAHERWQAGAMIMSVIVQRTELIAWYQRRGYRRTGQFEPFPYGDERFGRPRRDDLRFERLRKTLPASAEVKA